MNWTLIRTLGNVKYFGISYGVLVGVPLLADLYVKANNANAAPDNLLSFPPTLRWLYFASFAFAIGFTIYQLFCPQEHRRFATSDEYLTNAFELYERSQPQHRKQIVLARLDSLIDATVIKEIKTLSEAVATADDCDRNKRQAALTAYVDTLHADAIQKYLLLRFGDLDRSRPIARWATTISFALGGFVLLILFLLRSYTVLFIA